MAALKPAVKEDATVTPGDSSQMSEGHRCGLVTICLGGGMDAAGIFECLNR